MQVLLQGGVAPMTFYDDGEYERPVPAPLGLSQGGQLMLSWQSEFELCGMLISSFSSSVHISGPDSAYFSMNSSW